MSEIKVKKRNGKTEPLDLTKIHRVVEAACEDISGVSVSELELRSELQFYNGISSEEIQETLIKSAVDLISENSPNYQFVAARLISFDLRKRVYGQYEVPPLYDIVQKNIDAGFYTKDFLKWYTKEEIDTIDTFIRHERDNKLTYAGMEQLRRKYLVKNRFTGQLFETPQIAFIMISATIFHRYPADTRMKWIKDFYNALSNFDISLPTPVMAGVRTPSKQFSSCTLIDVDDSLKSINAGASAIVEYAANKAGIGLNVGRIRAGGSKIRLGDTVHTGIIPFIKYFIGALKSCNQGSIRSASGTFHFPVWHYEFEDLIVLKNNKGTDDTRARAVDYSVQLNRTMYQRLIEGKDITFFSPSDVPGLYEAYFRDTDEFERLYTKYEADKSIRKKTLPAFDVFSMIAQERKETGRIYIMHVDLANEHGSLDPRYAPIYMSNLCQEILQHTKPLNNVNDDTGIVSLCTLAAINFGNVRTPADLERPAKLLVRALNELLDYQEYILPSAKNSTDKFRNIGIGVINIAYFIAKHNYKYTNDSVLEFLQPYVEAYSYFIIKESMTLAKETGPCEAVEMTRYKQGILPPMNYKRNLDEFVKHELLLDWEKLSEDCKTYGVKNATMMALMPSETSSQISNSTNGIEPPRSLISIKNSKDGALAQVVPEYQRLKNKYELVWDQESPRGYLKVAALFAKFIDQSVSTNTSYNPEHYPDNEIPMSDLVGDMIFAYQIGLKTLYYNNTNDMAGEIDVTTDMSNSDIENIDLEHLSQENCEACTI